MSIYGWWPSIKKWPLAYFATVHVSSSKAGPGRQESHPQVPGVSQGGGLFVSGSAEEEELHAAVQEARAQAKAVVTDWW